MLGRAGHEMPGRPPHQHCDGESGEHGAEEKAGRELSGTGPRVRHEKPCRRARAGGAADSDGQGDPDGCDGAEDVIPLGQQRAADKGAALLDHNCGPRQCTH